MENKKVYELPTVEVAYFEIADILSTSGGSGNGGSDDNIHLPEVDWGDSQGR